MKIIEVPINKDGDIAKQVGEAVAKAIEESGKLPGDCEIDTEETATDNLDQEGMRALAESEEFETFHNEAAERTNSLIEFFSEHQAQFGCSIVVGVTMAYGKENSFGQAAVCGRGDSVRASLERISEHEGIGGLLGSILLRKIIH